MGIHRSWLRGRTMVMIVLLLCLTFTNVWMFNYDDRSYGAEPVTKQLAMYNSGTVMLLDEQGHVQRVTFAEEEMNAPTWRAVDPPLIESMPELTNVVSISAQNQLAFFVRDDGSVWVWGRSMEWNRSLVTGLNQKMTRAVPVPMLHDIRDIQMDNGRFYALTSEGTVWWWGQSIYLDAPMIFQVPGLVDVEQIVCIGTELFARKKDGTVWAWGDTNPFSANVVTNNNTPNPDFAIRIASLKNIDQMAWHNRGVLVLKDREGKLLTYNHFMPYGNLQRIDQLIRTIPTKSPVKTLLSGYAALVSLSDGSTHSLVVVPDPTDSDFNYQWTLQPETRFGTVVALASGMDSNVALLTNNSLWMWQHSNAPKAISKTTSTQANGLRKLMPIGISKSFDVIPSSGYLQPEFHPDVHQYDWYVSDTQSAMLSLKGIRGDLQFSSPGKNWTRAAQLTVPPNGKSDRTLEWTVRNDGGPDEIYTVRILSMPEKCHSISTGDFSSFCIDTKGELIGWGMNQNAQFGIQDQLRRKRPTNLHFEGKAASVYGSSSETYVVDSRGQLWMAGTLWSTDDPMRTSKQLTKWTSIKSFDHIKFAKGRSQNSYQINQMGNFQARTGYATKLFDNVVPSIQYGDFDQIVDYDLNRSPIRDNIEIQPQTHMLVDNVGKVWSLGENDSAQAGTSLTEYDHFKYNQVLGLPPIQKVAGGEAFFLALARDGTVWGWGENLSRQAGSTAMPYVLNPMRRKGLRQIKDIASGRNFGVALDSNGNVWTWGDNTYGQLGQGDQMNRYLAVQVKGIPQMVQVKSGLDHVLALAKNGSVWSWGRNQEGQVGNGRLIDQLKPVMVMKGRDD